MTASVLVRAIAATELDDALHPKDAQLRRAIDVAVAAEPGEVLGRWCLAAARGPAGEFPSAASAIADVAARHGAGDPLDVAVAASAVVLARQPAAVREAWAAAWADALDGLKGVEVAPVAIPAINAHLDGDSAAFLRLPVEMREALEKVIAESLAIGESSSESGPSSS